MPMTSIIGVPCVSEAFASAGPRAIKSTRKFLINDHDGGASIITLCEIAPSNNGVPPGKVLRETKLQREITPGWR